MIQPDILVSFKMYGLTKREEHFMMFGDINSGSDGRNFTVLVEDCSHFTFSEAIQYLNKKVKELSQCRIRNFRTINATTEKVEKTISSSNILGESETDTTYGASEDVNTVLARLKSLG